MDKTEAIKRLDALDEEAKKLREIIEQGDRLEYDGHKMYVVIIDGRPYLLAGQSSSGYARWHSFDKSWLTEQGWTMSHKTGQEALDYVKEYDIHVFTNGKEGVKFFYEQYMK
jgi:hypothetical protein